MAERLSRQEAELVKWLAERLDEIQYELRTGNYEWKEMDDELSDLLCHIDEQVHIFVDQLVHTLESTPVQTWAEKVGLTLRDGR